MEHRPVRTLNPEVARKIAAGEVIDRPQAIVRELMDNAVDSGADQIDVELEQGGIEKIRVIDNGCGMSKEDLVSAAHPHATSKIASEEDLLKLSTLGFRGEALCSMAAVSRLEITSGGYRMNASITEDHVITPVTPVNGTIVQTCGLFENFPARRVFLKRPSSEGQMCRAMFEEKVLPVPQTGFSLTMDHEKKLVLPKGQSLKERFCSTYGYSTSELFYEIQGKGTNFSFSLIIGEPSVTCDTRKKIYIYVNGRRIQEYSLVQAIEYGCQGFFPNGMHPVACLFATVDPDSVDFNIHPAKREARFKDINALHHGVSSGTREFFRQYTVKTMLSQDEKPGAEQNGLLEFNTPGIADLALNGSQENPAPQTDYTSVERKPFDSETCFTDMSNEETEATSVKTDFKISSADSEQVSSTVQGNSNTAYGTDARSRFFDTSTNRHNTRQYNESLFRKAVYQKNAADYSETSTEEEVTFVGCALGTFIIAEKNNTLYIIDQHAADERWRYNELMAHAGEKQSLLVPYEIQTDSSEDDNYLESIKDKLNESGFDIKNCGNGKWECSSVPVRWKGNQTDLQHDLLDKRVAPEEIISSIAAMTACRSSVMDGTCLSDEKAALIAERALKLPDPHCPHGRPVFTSITREQLFALVKRT